MENQMIQKADRILITGGSGFVWANLVRKLVKLWFQNIFLILREGSDIWRINDVIDRLNIEYWTLTDSIFVENCVKKISPDIIYHLAANGVTSETSITNLFTNNVFWTINLLSACVSNWFKYFVNTGSNFEYWKKNQPFKESDSFRPDDDYSVSKASSTLYSSYIWRKYSLPVYTYRLFCVFGPYENKKRLIPHLFLSYINNKKPNLSTPDSVRDFIFVDDVVNYYLNVDSINWDFWWIYNIWSWKQYSIWEIVEYVKKISNSGINPCYWTNVSRWNEATMYMANTNKIDKTFTIKQKNIEEWLRETYWWFLDNYKLYL